jgi:folylpolyglutamate synthase
VSALDYDHTAILGKTIELIAWHKAGIFKRGTPAFTINQEAGGMNVLCERAAEIGAPLSIVPDLSLYPGMLPELGLSGKYQQSNAALAIQLCQTWIQKRETGTVLKQYGPLIKFFWMFHFKNWP